MADKYESETFDVYMLGIIFIIALVFGMFFYMFPIILIGPWALFRVVESYLFGLFSDLHRDLRVYLLNTSWLKIGYSTAFSVERELMFHSTWIYLTIFLKPVINILRKKTVRDRLSKRLSLEDILEQETHVWRYNRWLVKFNPSEETTSVTEGRFAIRESLFSGLKRTQVITIDRLKNKVIYDETLLKKVFINQLRYPNNGIDNLTQLQKQLFCVFALREPSLKPIFSKSESSSAMLKRSILNLVLSPLNFAFSLYLNKTVLDFAPKPLKVMLEKWERMQINDNEDLRIFYLGDISFVLSGELDASVLHWHTERIFEVARTNEAIQSLSKQHAFVETFLRRMLFEARDYGKLPPNHFSWLKLYDRTLWYALNDEMLPSGSFESMGIKSHFELELQSGLPEPFPQVEQGMMLVKGIATKMTVSEFDHIKVYMKHPYSKLYPYDPHVPYQAHLQKLKDDPSYELKIFKITHGIVDD
jgi:hypothetical protein